MASPPDYNSTQCNIYPLLRIRRGPDPTPAIPLPFRPSSALDANTGPADVFLRPMLPTSSDRPPRDTTTTTSAPHSIPQVLLRPLTAVQAPPREHAYTHPALTVHHTLRDSSTPPVQRPPTPAPITPSAPLTLSQPSIIVKEHDPRPPCASSRHRRATPAEHWHPPHSRAPRDADDPSRARSEGPRRRCDLCPGPRMAARAKRVKPARAYSQAPLRKNNLIFRSSQRDAYSMPTLANHRRGYLLLLEPR